MKKVKKVCLHAVLGLLMGMGVLFCGDVRHIVAYDKDKVIVSGDYEYVVLDDGTAELVEFHGTGMDRIHIKVPSEIDGVKVSTIGEYLYSGAGGNFTVDIPEGVTTIKQFCFAGSSSLYQVNIPRTVSYIGESTFLACTELEDIIFPTNLREINIGIFDGCIGLKDFDIPENVETIREEAFRDSGVYRMLSGRNVSRIETTAFDGCDQLNSLIILGTQTILEDASIPSTVKLYGYIGSTTDEYAKKNGNEFITYDPITDIILSADQLELRSNYHESAELNTKVLPENAQYQKLKWTSSDPEVASVDAYGKVVALSKGTALITASAVGDSKASASCKVSVVTEAEEISLDTDTLSLDLGDSQKREMKVNTSFLPQDSNYQEVVWSSSNSDVATVDQDGKVMAQGNGEAVITATLMNELAYDFFDQIYASASCKVTVKTSMSQIKLNNETLNLVLGQEEAATLSVNAMPESASNKIFSWLSTNPSVATVDQNGKVQAIASGETEIIVRAEDGSGITASCWVYVLSNAVVNPPVTEIPNPTAGPTIVPQDVNVCNLNKSYVSLDLVSKKTYQLYITDIMPVNATTNKLRWSSSNPKVASVDSGGLVTAQTTGQTVITATLGNGYSVSCVVGVRPVKTSKFISTKTTTKAAYLSWKKVKGATGYKLYRWNPTKKIYELRHRFNQNTTTFTDTGLKSGMIYQYKLIPYISITTVGMKKQLSGEGVILKVATKPDTPQIIKAESKKVKGKRGIYVSWKKVARTKGYVISFSEKKSSGYKRVATLKNSSRSFTKRGLKKGKYYYIKVRSYIMHGNQKIFSGYSKIVRIKCK